MRIIYHRNDLQRSAGAFVFVSGGIGMGWGALSLYGVTFTFADYLHEVGVRKGTGA